MLAVRRGVSVLRVPGNRFKEDLLCFLLGVWNKTNCLVVPWIFLLAFSLLAGTSLDHYNLSKVI